MVAVAFDGGTIFTACPDGKLWLRGDRWKECYKEHPEGKHRCHKKTCKSCLRGPVKLLDQKQAIRIAEEMNKHLKDTANLQNSGS